MPRVVDHHLGLLSDYLGANGDADGAVCKPLSQGDQFLDELLFSLLGILHRGLSPFFSPVSPQRREPIVGYPYQFL